MLRCHAAFKRQGRKPTAGVVNEPIREQSVGKAEQSSITSGMTHIAHGSSHHLCSLLLSQTKSCFFHGSLSIWTHKQFFFYFKRTFTNGAQRHAIFLEIQKKMHPHRQPLELEQPSDTRWSSRASSVSKVLQLLYVILEMLAQFSEKNGKTKFEADSLLHQVQRKKFLFLLVMFGFLKLPNLQPGVCRAPYSLSQTQSV